jgi:protein-tyrosine-phosphatase
MAMATIDANFNFPALISDPPRFQIVPALASYAGSALQCNGFASETESSSARTGFDYRNLLTWSIPDPEASGGEPEARKMAFRQARDRIRNRVEEFVEAMNRGEGAILKTRALAA